MKVLLSVFKYLALVGFLASFAAHIASLFGRQLFAGVAILHIGLFVVFAPAVLIANKTFGSVRASRKDFWKIILLGCPLWMKNISYAVFFYAIFNFLIFIVSVNSNHPHTLHSPFLGSMPPEVVRGFSGHWMIFYWASFVIFYSQSNPRVLPGLTCAKCKSSASPFDHFCANCGEPLPK